VTDTQKSHNIEVRRQVQLAGQLVSVEEADPPHTDALGTRGQPEILDCQGRRERRHPRVRVSPQGVRTAPGGVAGNHDVQRGRQDRLHLDAVEQSGSSGRQGGGEDVALAGSQSLDALALREITQQQEVPRLAQTHAGGLVGRDQDALENGVIDRFHGEPPPDVAPHGDGLVDRRTTLGFKSRCTHG